MSSLDLSSLFAEYEDSPLHDTQLLQESAPPYDGAELFPKGWKYVRVTRAHVNGKGLIVHFDDRSFGTRFRLDQYPLDHFFRVLEKLGIHKEYFTSKPEATLHDLAIDLSMRKPIVRVKLDALDLDVRMYLDYPILLDGLLVIPYRDYLNTGVWRKTRTAIFRKRGGRRCEVCEVTDDIDVHHLTYRNVGREHAEDLQVLCRSCHDKAEAAK